MVKNLCSGAIGSRVAGPALRVAAMKKARIDAVLAERGLFPSRTAAAGAVRAGEVRVGRDGPVALRPSQLVEPEAALIVDEGPRYVSRGGIKLENALETLGIDVAGRDCLDVGASTGGFTDCLLQRGAARVAAVDVAYGQIDLRLREDPRVTVIERLNARELRARRPALRARAGDDRRLLHLPGQDPARGRRLPGARQARSLAMVKPQFELGRERVGRGVVRDAGDRREAILAVAQAADELGLAVRGFASSGLPGPKGNRETFVWCGGDGDGLSRPRGRDRRGGGGGHVKTAALITHSHPPAADRSGRDGRQRSPRGRLAPGRHGGRAREARRTRPTGIEQVDSLPADPDLCLVLGGDGSILTRCAASPAPACRSSASTSAPSASSPRSSATMPSEGIRRALAGEIETIDLPALEIDDRRRAARRPQRRQLQPPSRTTGSPS